MKIFKILISGLALGALANACDSNTTTTTVNPYADMTEFEIACNAMGGVHENGKCLCDKIACDDGEVCNAVTKKCPEKTLPEVCAKDSVTCSNGIMYRCNNNSKFVEDKTCPNGCLPDKSGCAECISDSCNKGTIRKCVDGVYQEMTPCESNECISETACSKECEENDRICRNGRIQICVDEHYKDHQKCEYGCDEKTGNSCASSCKEGAALCTDGQIKTCTGGKFGAAQACEDHNSCRSETECGECVNKEIYCVDDEKSKIGYLRTCVNGSLNEGFICNDDHSCNSKTNKCGVCKNGERRCVNDDETQVGKIQICEYGEFVDESDCEENASCKSATMCGECINNTLTCTNDENALGTEHICLNGVNIPKPCADGNSCNKDKCGECRNGVQKCGTTTSSVNMLLFCNDGRQEKDACSNINSLTPWCPPGKKECQKDKGMPEG